MAQRYGWARTRRGGNKYHAKSSVSTPLCNKRGDILNPYTVSKSSVEQPDLCKRCLRIEASQRANKSLHPTEDGG